MDPATISVTAAAALTVLQPYLFIIATKAAEKLGSELPAAVGKLWTALKTRLDQKEAGREALSGLLKNPNDPELQVTFRVLLKQAMESDKDFAQEIKRLTTEAAGSGPHIQVGDGAVAYGANSKAVGRGGVIIDGNSSGNTIITGDNKQVNKRS